MTKVTLGIKKGDTVKILAGKERGKTGKVLEVVPKLNRLVVEGLHIRVRFSKPKRQGEKGQRLELPAPINASKAMLICPLCGKPTRIGHEVNERGSFRKCKQCGKTI
jgi:large subunit ribosomal protein L24